jgi:hypothetical protein
MYRPSWSAKPPASPYTTRRQCPEPRVKWRSGMWAITSSLSTSLPPKLRIGKSRWRKGYTCIGLCRPRSRAHFKKAITNPPNSRASPTAGLSCVCGARREIRRCPRRRGWSKATTSAGNGILGALPSRLSAPMYPLSLPAVPASIAATPAALCRRKTGRNSIPHIASS